MDTSVPWANLISTHLGSKLKHRSNELQSNIQFVDFGLKPAYLVDFGVSTLESVVNLVIDLKCSNLIHNNLKAVAIGMDYLIVNPEEFVKLHSESLMVKFVDISSTNDTPKILDKNDVLELIISTCFSIVMEDGVASEYTEIKDVNLSTVFGLLIGYPVVYWFDSDSLDRVGNPQVVQHVEVLGRRTDTQTNVIYSFSFPDCLCALEEHVNKWFERWRENGKWKQMFQTVSLKFERKTLVSFVL
ncbi:UPF0739 protein C1orf74 homolog [Saccostrea cucullata]|uniref:UPF0739 protein C1orf74 homolog n=1 Tax=Saccostrea cuccullata TaxID=36930 RepID=UPI002ED4D8A3